MYHHMIKLSSTAAASPRIRKFSSTVKAAAASPISVVLYPKNNNNKEVKEVMEEDKKSEESIKKPAAAALEISLRPFQLTDVDDIMVWGTDEKLLRYCRWKIYKSKEAYCGWETIKPNRYFGETYRYRGWNMEIYRSKEDALKDIKNNIIPHPWYRAICLKNRPIGKIFVDPCRRNNPVMAELGYFVASEHWGKGIATTAVKMVLDTIFKEWPYLLRLQGGHVHVENLGAQRVLEKAGFLNEGVHVHFENLGAQRVLEKAGFTKEGVFRKYFPDKEGRRMDLRISKYVMYVMSRRRLLTNLR